VTVDEIAAVIAWVEGEGTPLETGREPEYRQAAREAALFIGWDQ